MKKISAIVRPEKLEPLKDALFAAKVSGMTISQVHGCGNQHGWKEYYRGTEVMLNMVPKVKFEIIVNDEPQLYDGWLIFLDELTSAPKHLQAPAYKLILDRMIGTHKLHPRVVIAAAGIGRVRSAEVTSRAGGSISSGTTISPRTWRRRGPARPA